MAITTAQIRDLLNRPRGLNDATISEYITIRTEEVNKTRRSSTLYGINADTAPSDTQTESAIKFLVCVDCLRVMIDTFSMYFPEPEQRRTDIRLSAQLKSFEAQAEKLLSQVAERGGTSFAIDSSNTRQA